MRRVTLLLCASLAFILTSCLGPGGGLSGNWSRVYEATFTTTDTTDAVVYSKEDYRVRIDILDITKEQMNITFPNFRLTESDSPLTLLFEDVPYTITYSEDGRSRKYVFDVKSAIPHIEDVDSADYEVESLQGELSGKENITIRFAMKRKPYKVEFTDQPKQ